MTSVLPFPFLDTGEVSGGNGSACSERLRCVVDEDDAKVECGCVTLREMRSCDLACRMAALQESRSSSVAVGRGKR